MSLLFQMHRQSFACDHIFVIHARNHPLQITHIYYVTNTRFKNIFFFFFSLEIITQNKVVLAASHVKGRKTWIKIYNIYCIRVKSDFIRWSIYHHLPSNSFNSIWHIILGRIGGTNYTCMCFNNVKRNFLKIETYFMFFLCATHGISLYEDKRK